MSEEEDEQFDDGRSDPRKPTKLVRDLRHRYSADFVGHPFYESFRQMDEERERAAEAIMGLRWKIRKLRDQIRSMK